MLNEVKIKKMEKTLGTPNQKAAYSRLGMVAEKAQSAMDEAYNNASANTVIKAINGQTRIFEAEIKSVHARVRKDEHNQKYGTNISMRNIETKPFDY